MRVLILLIAVVLVGAPAASAQRVNAPPGNSEVDQYFETVPDGAGNTSVDRGGPPDPGAAVLDPKVRAELEALGEDGVAVANLAERNSVRQNAGGASDKPAVLRYEEPSSGAIAGIWKAITGSGDDGGMGLFLPLLLLGTFVVGVFAALAGRRREA